MLQDLVIGVQHLGVVPLGLVIAQVFLELVHLVKYVLVVGDHGFLDECCMLVGLLPHILRSS